MAERPRLILLPGLDGTGLLFQPFLAALGPQCETQVIAYPTTGPQDYPTLTRFVAAQLPQDGDFALLAESFSGPIAYRIATTFRRNLKTVIFVATFLESPRPLLLRASRIFPARLLSMRVPDLLVRRLLLGRQASGTLIELFWQAVRSGSPHALKARLQAISMLPAPVDRLCLPCSYIAPTADRLVPRRCVQTVQRLAKALSIYGVQSGHFVLQSQPEICARIVRHALGISGGNPHDGTTGILADVFPS